MKDSVELLKPDIGANALAARENIESILRFAIEQKANVETLERLMAIRREWNSEQAKQAFYAALSAFQAECPTIAKNTPALGRDGKAMYHYAAMDAVIDQTKALREKHGFSHSFDTEVKPGWVKVGCTITHSRGHSSTSFFEVPATSKSPMMNDPQMYAAALTFLQRYTFCAAFGIATAQQDKDGRTSEPKPPGPSTLAAEPSVKDLARQLWTLLAPVRGAEKNWNQANDWLWRHELLDSAAEEAAPNLSPERFRKLLEAVRNLPDHSK